MYHRKQLIANNGILKRQIFKRDSIIVLQKDLQSVCLSSITDLKLVTVNLSEVIKNKDKVIATEIKIGKKRSFWNIIKGAGGGLLLGILLTR